jgi:ABC-type amino acid transport substrate-binding protein
VKITPPFITKNADSYSGLSIELWESIARKLNYSYSYREMDLSGLISALENDEIDICINPLTVTSERVADFDFTQPFFITNLSIAAGEEGTQIVQFLKNFFSVTFFKAVGLLFSVILVFGVLVWVFERRHNEEMFGDGLTGIWHGIWWSAVTMTTVGYGDKAPKTVGGKVIGLIWMFTAIIIISGFTASIASALTINNMGSSIQSPSDLKRVETGVLGNSSSEAYMYQHGYATQPFNDANDALSALAEGKIDAFVYDEPILRYLIQDNSYGNNVGILPIRFNTQYYGFALPKANKKRIDAINPVLLEEIKSARWQRTQQRYGLDI